MLRGRDAELGDLAATLRAGGSALLVGEAGVGKTALWNAALADAKVAGDRVVRCVASHAAATVPLAALAPLLDPGTSAESTLERVLLALDALRPAGSRSDAQVVLAVDDAHLLDDAAAAAVRVAAESQRAVLLLTMRTGAPAPDAISGLAKDGVAHRITVAPLDPDAAAAVVGDLLGGEVDAGTSARLFSVAGGNALFLRELVAHGRTTGALAPLGGLWTWHGELRPGPRLTDIVAARLDALDPDARYAAELVAAAEPVPLEALEAVVASAPLAAAERLGILVAEKSQRRMFVRCVHPLHAAALRERAAHSAVRAGLALLVDTLEASGARRADDALRIGQWLLAAGRASRPELLTAAASRAHAHGYVLLAERLARAAIDAGGGDDARLVLHETLIWQARVREADAVGVESTDERSRALLAGARVDAFLVGGEPYESVVAALDAADVITRAPDLRAELAARRSGLDLAATGRPEAATRPWDALGESGSGVPPVVVVRLAFGAVPALAAVGRTADALAAAERGLGALATLDEPLTFAAEQLSASTGFALLLAGRLFDADECVIGAYDGAVRSGDRFAQALLAVPAAELDLWRGRPVTAARRAAEALALSDGVDRMGFRVWAAGLRAHASAWLARSEAVAVDDEWPPSGEFLHAFSRLSFARAALARGEFSVARDLAIALGARAERHGQPAVAVLANHVVARAGSPRGAAEVLARLAAGCDGDLVPLLADHAAALAADDADALLAVAGRAEALGLVPLAAEASARAEVGFATAGHRDGARRAGLAARRLVERTGAPPCFPFGAADQPHLTDREREVATLAGRGLTNHEIADRLGLSVRTVHAHLRGAYAKLGTSERTELAAALGASGG